MTPWQKHVLGLVLPLGVSATTLALAPEYDAPEWMINVSAAGIIIAIGYALFLYSRTASRGGQLPYCSRGHVHHWGRRLAFRPNLSISRVGRIGRTCSCLGHHAGSRLSPSATLEGRPGQLDRRYARFPPIADIRLNGTSTLQCRNAADMRVGYAKLRIPRLCHPNSLRALR